MKSRLASGPESPSQFVPKLSEVEASFGDLRQDSTTRTETWIPSAVHKRVRLQARKTIIVSAKLSRVRDRYFGSSRQAKAGASCSNAK